MKKRFLGILVLFVAGLVSTTLGFWSYETFAVSTPQSTSAKQTTAVRRGSIAATVSTSGSTAAVYSADLSFDSAGRVGEALVGAGESVKKGQALAKLDTADLELQLSRAEVALDSAKVKLQQLNKGPEQSEVAAAQASYDSAVEKLTKLKAGTSAEDLAVAKASYDSAVEKLVKLKAGTSAEELALAKASYDSALANVEELKAKPTADEIKTAEAAVRDAEVAFANAQNSLVVTQKSRTASRAVYDLENEHNWYEANYGDKLAKFEAGKATQQDVDKAWSNLMAAKERLFAGTVGAL